jgi:TP901 family phage tail tape measure protein
MLANKMKAAEQPSASLTNKFNTLREAVNQLSEQETQLVRRLDQTRHSITAAGIPMRSLTEAQRALRRETASTTQAMQQQASAMSTQINRQERLAVHQRQIAAMRHRMQDSLQLQQDISGVAYPALAAGTSMIYGATRPVMQSANLSDIANDIAITGNMTRQEEASLREELRRIAVATNQEQADIGKGVQILVANGMEAKDAGSYAELLGKTATASRAQMEDVANLTFSLQNALKINGKAEMVKSMNYLVHAGKQGQFELRDMARYFPQLASQMASFGATGQQAVKQLGIGMQVSRKASGTSQEAATNMANWFSHMTAGSTVKHFQEAGVDFRTEMMRRMNPADPKQRMSALEASLDILDGYIDKLTAGKTVQIKTANGKIKETLNFKQALEKAQASGNKAEVQALVERFGVSSILQDMQTTNYYLAMRQNKAMFRDGMASFDQPGVENTLDTDFQRRLESPIEQFKQAKIAFADTMTQMGDTILPMLTPLIREVTAIAERVTAWAKANPELVSTIIKVGVVLGALMIAFGGIAMTIIGIVGPLAMLRFALGMAGKEWAFFLGRFAKNAAVPGAPSKMSKLTEAAQIAQSRLGKPIDAAREAAKSASKKTGSPVIWTWQKTPTLAKWANAGAGFVGRSSMLQGIFAGLRAVPLPQIKLLLAAGYLLYKWFGPLKEMFSGFFEGFAGALKSTVPELQKLWTNLKGLGGSLLNMMTNLPVIGPIFAMLTNDVKVFFTWLDKLITPTKATENGFRDFGKTVGDIVGTMLVKVPVMLFDLGVRMVKGLVDGIASVASWVNQALANLAEKIFGSGTKPPETKVPATNIAASNVARNGGARATGGPVNAGHFYRVNELGPELLQMSGMTYLMMGGANGQITPLTAQQAANEPRHASNVHPIPQRRAGDKPIVVTQHNTITIHATPGMDAQAIARAVSEQLEAAERKQAARRRAAMYD